MKTLMIEDDLHAHIMDEVAQTGKSPSDVLRSRKLNDRNSQEVESDSASGELATFLRSSRLQAHRTAVKKYLAILAFVYQQKPDEFRDVEKRISGRSRKYFSRSKEELAQSGTHVNPQPIPNSPFWTATNNSTPRKRTQIQDVLRFLGYEAVVVKQAKDAI